MPASLRREIADQYYLTTAARGHAANREHYEYAAKGLLRRLRPWLPADRGARCLDLACGCGEAIYALEREGFTNTSGVDLCAEEIEQARSHVKGRLYRADAPAHLGTLKARSLDFITALNFLEHLDKDTLLELLRECARVLAPGGTMVAMVPNATSPFGGTTRHWDITHEWAFVPNNMHQLAVLAGLGKKVEFRECGPIPHGLVSGVRYLLWRVIRAMIAGYMLIEVASTRGGIFTMDMMVRFAAAEDEPR